MVSTSRYFCQNCRKEISRNERRIIRLENPNAIYGKKTLKRAQVCTKCAKITEKYLAKMEKRLGWTNRNVIMRDEYDSKKSS